MSSPVRQMNHRRLPPLPGVAPHKRHGPKSPVSDIMVTGVTCSPMFVSPQPRGSHSSSTMYSRTPDLQADTVTQFLFDNPDFLDSHVTQHVHEDRVRQWFIRKQRNQSRNTVPLTNGDLIKGQRSNWKVTNEEQQGRIYLKHNRYIQSASSNNFSRDLLTARAIILILLLDMSLSLIVEGLTGTFKQKISNKSAVPLMFDDEFIDIVPTKSPTDNRRRRRSRSRLLAAAKNCVQSNKWRVLQDLTKDSNTSKTKVLVELANCASECVNADGHNLYLIDDHSQLYLASKSSKNQRSPTTCIGKIEPRTTLPAYVAYVKESMSTHNLVGDPRFPMGLGVDCDKAASAIAVPLLQGNNTVIGVVEMYRHYGSLSFSPEEEEVAQMMLIWTDISVEYVEIADNVAFWGCIAVFYIEMYNNMMKQRKLNDFLLAVTKSIFQDIVSMDTVIMKIMNYAKKLVVADRASLFLLDTKSRELYARIFDTGRVEEHIPQKEIRFPMDRGVAGHVASTGEVLNINDAYTDSRFNRDVDLQTGYRTKSILCMPIYNRGNIIGVVQMVNKLDGVFTKSDEESFETFAIYCGLALHHAKLYDKIRRSEQKYKVAVEVLSYHSQCNEEEYMITKNQTIPDYIPDIIDYDYSPWAIDNDTKPVYVLYMMRDIFKMHTQFDIDDMIRFTLTVRKNYRNVPYHNWAHAFSVAHAMYAVIKTASHYFTPVECLALYVACLCHDLDHRGKTNAFMVKSASPLAAIYSTSTMEHHHFNHTVTILQNEGHNIFKHLTSAEYKQILSDVRHCILATDLALFFSNRSRLQDIADKGQFSWKDPEHRRLVMANSMTACDLCSMYKPWNLQLQLVDVIMEEFWQQGDQEKIALGHVQNPIMDRDRIDELPESQGDEERSQGLTPMPMMDRQKKNELPHLEVGFLVGICLPCYEVMAQILPETQPMVDGAVANLKKWRELAENEEKGVTENRENEAKGDPENHQNEDDLKSEVEIDDSNKTETKEENTSDKNVIETNEVTNDSNSAPVNKTVSYLSLDDSASDTSFMSEKTLLFPSSEDS